MPAFKEMYPNIQIELLSFDLHEYEAKLAVAVPTGNGPDILTLHDYIFPHYYDNDALDVVPADLVATINNPKIIDPVFTRILSRDGKPWACPGGRAAAPCSTTSIISRKPDWMARPRRCRRCGTTPRS